MRDMEVHRYFFSVRWSDHEDDDLNGRLLYDDAAALSYADRLVRELRASGGYDDPSLMVIVRDSTQKVVVSIPFLPACA